MGNVILTSGSNTSKVSVTFYIAESGSPCDVNQDHQINVADVPELINAALGERAPANDLNSDRVVSVVDIMIDINAVLPRGCSAH
jgi:hypothetical protein